MTNDMTRLLRAGTVSEVCRGLEEILVELRSKGHVERLPPKFRAISAQDPDAVIKWCELLDQSSFMHGRLDYYYILFDTARARLEYLAKDRIKGSIPYIVYVSREEESAATAGARRFSTMDDAARACISLREQGYKILRVRLPSGNYVTGSQIEWAIKVGVSNVKIALTR
jgi:hypothetical protein